MDTEPTGLVPAKPPYVWPATVALVTFVAERVVESAPNAMEFAVDALALLPIAML